MKKIRVLLSLLVILGIVLTAAVGVSAASDWSAKLEIEQLSEIIDDKTFTVRVSVSDITSESGIVCAIYHVHYDSDVLELVSWENGHPSDWDFADSTFGAEDWTSVIKDEKNVPYLMYTVMNTNRENGVVDDNVLYTDITFKVLSDTVESTTLSVTNISFIDKSLENDCELSDQYLDIVLKSAEDISQPESSAEESSGNSDDSSEELEESVTSDETSLPVDLSVDSSIEVSSEYTDESSDEVSKRITMTVLIKDIKDKYGVSALQFSLKYKPSLLQFVSYESIIPDNWDLNTEYTEELCSVETNGDLMFCVMNYESGCGVKEDGVLGFQIVFDAKNVEFDPSLITMEEILLINDNLEDVAEEDYRLEISYDGYTVDTFSSPQDEGKAIKIVVAIVSCTVLLAVAVCVFVLIRRKKQG